MSEDKNAEPIAKELEEAKIKDVIEAVGKALKGEDGIPFKGLDADEETLQTALDGAVQKALDISPIDALMKAWRGLGAVRKLTGEEGPMDGKARNVAIASHTLKTEHKPAIHVELGKAATLKKVPVPVTFSLKIEGLILSVLNRQITQIAAGKAKPEVTVEVENVTIVREKLKPINLPLDVTLYEEPKAVPEPA